jgi:hypothetical protein
LKTEAIVVDEKRRRKKTRKTWYTGYTISKEVNIHHGLENRPTTQPMVILTYQRWGKLPPIKTVKKKNGTTGGVTRKR